MTLDDLDRLAALVAAMKSNDPEIHYGLAAGELLDAAPELLRLARFGIAYFAMRLVCAPSSDAVTDCPVSDLEAACRAMEVRHG